MLASAALAVATLLGVWLGVTGGSRPASLLEPVIGGMSIVALSLPSLLLALLAARTGWFPVSGISSVGSEELGWIARVSDLAWYLTLPALAVAIPLTATIERLQSQAMTETLELPFVRAAVARGLTWRRVVWRHAFPVALRPVLGVYGIIIGSVFSGSFVVEVVSAWPGLGQLMYEALVSRDPYLIAGCGMAGSACLAIGNLASDAALMTVDPRARTES